MRGALELAALVRRQWWAPERIERYRLSRLRRLLHHTCENVPFYRRLYAEAGVSPDSIASVGDLARLPIVRREQIQHLGAELLAGDADLSRCVRSSTSGSTGVPLEIVSSSADRAVFNPSFFRVYLGAGLKPWHRLTYFQARRERLGARSWYEGFGLYRRQMLSTHDEPESWVAGIRRWRPYLIHGYSLTLKLLAEATLEHGGGDLRVPLVASTSGILDATGRELLTTALGCRVIDIYASEEAGSVIAWECPECAAYHLSNDTVITELLHDGRPARPGEDATVVVTNLSNFTMPFIRYDQGDVVRVSERVPVCGRGLPLIEEVRGRSGDFVLLASGRKLSPHPFFLVLDHAMGVGCWQVVQEDLDRIVVRTTVARDAGAADVDGIRAGIRALVGEEVRVEVEVVEQLRRDPALKLRSVISKLPEAQTDRKPQSHRVTEPPPAR